jgi:hypothetical protein
VQGQFQVGKHTVDRADGAAQLVPRFGKDHEVVHETAVEDPAVPSDLLHGHVERVQVERPEKRTDGSACNHSFSRVAGIRKLKVFTDKISHPLCRPGIAKQLKAVKMYCKTKPGR